MKTYQNSKQIQKDLILCIVSSFFTAIAVVCILVAAKYEVIDKVFKMINP